MSLPPSALPLALFENELGLALFAALTLALIVAIAFALTRGSGAGSVYDRIGAGGISREEDYGAHVPAADSAAARAEREREIRQMLHARSERRVRAGGTPLDVEGELQRLLAEQEPARQHDAELLSEVRQLVLARNERRVREGREPLDVEAEVTRTLAELDR